MRDEQKEEEREETLSPATSCCGKQMMIND